jgi:hypothetical protein
MASEVHIGSGDISSQTSLLHRSVKINYYCLCQFTWCLHSTEKLLAQHVTTWFMQDDQACSHQSDNILFASLLHICTAHTVHTKEKCYFGW